MQMAMTETVRKLLVGGEWYETGETLDVTSPFDGSVVAQVAFGGAEDARRALDAAEQAWASPLPAHKRAAILDRVAELIAERREEFGRTIAQEAGKPITTALIVPDDAAPICCAATSVSKLVPFHFPCRCSVTTRIFMTHLPSFYPLSS